MEVYLTGEADAENVLLWVSTPESVTDGETEYVCVARLEALRSPALAVLATDGVGKAVELTCGEMDCVRVIMAFEVVNVDTMESIAGDDELSILRVDCTVVDCSFEDVKA